MNDIREHRKYAKDVGLIIGNKYRAKLDISIEDYSRTYLKPGEKVTFQCDDNTYCPKFVKEDGEIVYIYCDDVEEISDTEDIVHSASIGYTINGITTVEVNVKGASKEFLEVVLRDVKKWLI